MIQPSEMKKHLPMDVANNQQSTTSEVWEILVASKEGDLPKIKELITRCPGLAYAQYNYTPPIHFAVREGHAEITEYLLRLGALDPTYITYPFKDTLLTVASERNDFKIKDLLEQYLADPNLCRFRGDNGEIHYKRSETEKEFEQAVDKGDLSRAEKLLQQQPDMVHDPDFFWSEGILMMPAKDPNPEMLQLLLRYGAKVPNVTKWGRAYYFKHFEIASLLMEHGMNPNHMSYHHVTLLHDMAQTNQLDKAKLLIEYGADINLIDEEYQSTPLGMAARWGHVAMVEYLLSVGAHPTLSGATWSTPLAWATAKGHEDVVKVLRDL